MTRNEMMQERGEIEAAFDAAKEAQSVYWMALSDLQTALGGVELDGNMDLADVSFEGLVYAHADDEDEEDDDDAEN